MNILFFPTGAYATNMYIICCKDTFDAVIIDPGVGGFEIVLEVVQQHSLKPTAIWLTHSHWDHIVDAAKMKRELSLPIYVHEEDKGNLEKPGSDEVPMAIPTIEATEPDHLIKDGDLLKVGKCIFKVIHTPGHTPGGVCSIAKGKNIDFRGYVLPRFDWVS